LDCKNNEKFLALRQHFTATLFSEHYNHPLMQKPSLERSAFIVLLIAIAIVVVIILSTTTAAPGSGTGIGTLSGNVTIGPLCPVEPCAISHEKIVAAYAARPIMITTEEGTIMGTVIPDPDTSYSITLRPGTYVVDIRHQGIGGSGDLPKTVTIRAGETIQLDISIDTGIR
jgi:hypothetical protein